MLSTLYQERLSLADGEQNTPRGPKSRRGEQLDEIAVFALVAIAVLYVAAASCWFVF